MSLKPVLGVVTVAALIAGGSFAVSLVDLLAPAEDEALGLVPADAAIYMNVFLDPSVPQQLALDDLLVSFPAAGSRAGARDQVIQLLDKGLTELGLTFEADIEPWLGDQIAFFMQAPANFTSEPGVAMLFEAEDIDDALTTVDKAQAADPSHTFTPRRYAGVDYEVDPSGIAIGAVDSFLVSGTESGVKTAIDASRGRSLGESEPFAAATSGLSEDRLALSYLNPVVFSGFVAPGLLPGAGFPPSGAQSFPLGEPSAVAAILYARSDALVIEASSKVPADPALGNAIRSAAGESKILQRLPGDAWLAIGAPDLGRSLGSILTAFERTFAQPQGGAFPGLPPGGLLGGFERALGLDLERDLLSWMGDAGFFVSGTNPRKVGGGAVIEATDPEAAVNAIDRLKAAAQKFDLPIRRSKLAGIGTGFALQATEMPEPFNVFAAGDRVVAIYGDAATGFAFASDPSLGGTADFEAARASLGDGYALGGFVDLSAVFELLERSGAIVGRYRHDLRPWYQPLSFVSFGTKIEGDSALQRVVLGVR